MTLKLRARSLAPSSLVLASPADWEELAGEVRAAVHPADCWRGQEQDKPLTMTAVRELIAFAAQHPVGQWKVACLFAADQFKGEVANALLKLLEEPPAYLYIILFSESPRLLPTVRSRVNLVTMPAQSAKIKNKPYPATPREQWQTVLSRKNLQLEQERKQAKNLLYLQTLVHPGIKVETVLEPFIEE